MNKGCEFATSLAENQIDDIIYNFVPNMDSSVDPLRDRVVSKVMDVLTRAQYKDDNTREGHLHNESGWK